MIFVKKYSYVKQGSSHQRQRGAGFIEVLVALVILAIGLLGVLSMQSRGLGSNQRAIFASEVNMLAADMADRILSFGTDGPTNEYDGISTLAAFAGPDPVVNQHAADWSLRLNASSLPSVQGNVDWNAATTSYTITLRWDDERAGAAGLLCPSNVRDANGNLVNLTCFQLTVSL